MPGLSLVGAAPGGSLQGQLLAAPGSVTGVVVGAPQLPVDTNHGQLWVGTIPALLTLGTMPATGSVPFQFPVPPGAPLGLALWFQPVSVTSSAQIWIGPPVRTTLH